jgi:alkylation response protein AidB-like acyl-CoA dehydrogenase
MLVRHLLESAVVTATDQEIDNLPINAPGAHVRAGLLAAVEAVKTTAVRGVDVTGSHYIVNDQKTWTTLGQHANMIYSPGDLVVVTPCDGAVCAAVH